MVLGQLGMVGKIPAGHEGGRLVECAADRGFRSFSVIQNAPLGSFLEREFL